VHASQSGETWAGAGTGAVGVEQLSELCLWRRRGGKDQSMAEGGDENSDHCLASTSQ
jgi:hypothetical protein